VGRTLAWLAISWNSVRTLLCGVSDGESMLLVRTVLWVWVCVQYIVLCQKPNCVCPRHMYMWSCVGERKLTCN